MQTLPSYVLGAAVSRIKINWRNDKCCHFVMYKICCQGMFGFVKV